MASIKIKDRLNEETPSLTVGEYLAVITREDGYTGTSDGNQLYEVQQYKTSGLKVVPVQTSKDGFSYESLGEEPVVIYDAGNDKVIYLKNALEEVYHGPHLVEEALEAGDNAEAKVMLGFMEYAKDAYRIGVQNFIIADAEILFNGASSISLNSTTASVEEGATYQIEATVEPSDADQNVTYTSADESIATVDETGAILGVSAGSTTVTVASEQDSSVTATVDVTVTATGV